MIVILNKLDNIQEAKRKPPQSTPSYREPGILFNTILYHSKYRDQMALDDLLFLKLIIP